MLSNGCEKRELKSFGLRAIMIFTPIHCSTNMALMLRWRSHLSRTLPEQKIYLAHGDLVNQDDQLYLRWREITRWKLFEKLWISLRTSLQKKYLLPFAEKTKFHFASRLSRQQAVSTFAKNWSRFCEEKIQRRFSSRVYGPLSHRRFFYRRPRFLHQPRLCSRWHRVTHYGIFNKIAFQSA